MDVWSCDFNIDEMLSRFSAKSLVCGERKFNVKIILDESRKENMLETQRSGRNQLQSRKKRSIYADECSNLIIIWWVYYTANVITSLQEKKLPIDAIWWNSYEWRKKCKHISFRHIKAPNLIAQSVSCLLNRINFTLWYRSAFFSTEIK